jgi:hypothetical protein
MSYDENAAARVRKALAGRRAVVEKKLMGGLCFMVNGSMSCSVSGRGGLLVRVDPQAYENMLREPHVAAVEMRGRVMGGFVRVAPDGYRTEAALKKWVERGVSAAEARPAKKGRSKTKRAAKKKKK